MALKNHGWIKVEDDKPKKNGYTQVFINGKQEVRWFSLFHGKWTGAMSKNGVATLTHWKPLGLDPIY